MFEDTLVDTATHGGIALGVQVDEQDALSRAGERSRQVDAGRGLADPTLLVGNGIDLRQGFCSPRGAISTRCRGAAKPGTLSS